MKSLKLLLFIIVYSWISVSCGPNDHRQHTPSSEFSKSVIDLTLTGEELFVKNCKLCHGINGRLELNGAKDLHLSTMDMPERILMITNGKNAMTPFKKVLTKEEIERVTKYTLTFSNR